MVDYSISRKIFISILIFGLIMGISSLGFIMMEVSKLFMGKNNSINLTRQNQQAL